MILIYPVVTMAESFTHAGSVSNLLGKKSSIELRATFSAERNVTEQTPPAFLVHTTADKTVSSLNSVYLYQALIKNNIKAEMHIYQDGNHGFGMKLPNGDEVWMERCRNWLKGNGWLKKN
jgi:dipeptidyl aminopeptidase/acylaminoacyl peptidase